MLMLKVKDDLYNLDKTAFVFIDCQNDFITGTLGSKEAQEAIKVIENIAEIPMEYAYATFDTHYDKDYLDTREGQKLPIKHCLIDSLNDGWDMPKQLERTLCDKSHFSRFNKYTFGTLGLPTRIELEIEKPECFVFVGFCTDICLIANVLIAQTYFDNEIPIVVIEDGCAGSTKENHEAALKVLRSCQIDVVNSKDISVEPWVGEVISKD